MIHKSYPAFGSPLAGLGILREGSSKRESSWDRTGRNKDSITIPSGSKKTIARLRGSGCIKHIWITVSCNKDKLYLRKILLRMFWDDEKRPSVEVPLGDFFGIGHAAAKHFVSLPLSMVCKPGRGNQAGMNCYFPMPYNKGARLEVENQCGCRIEDFYYYIDYETYEAPCAEAAYFHAQWRRENPCSRVIFSKQKGQLQADSSNEVNLDGGENYVILDAKGRGHFVGCVLNVDNTEVFHQNYTWFGEGDDMIFVDGETWPPSLHGTGTEDYFCSAWGFPSGEYAGPYHGVSLAGDVEEWSGKWSVYRFHIEDPVLFSKSLKVTIEHGHANNQGNDYSSVAYWYQKEPHKAFPMMLPVEKRLPNLRYR
jgi:hypothetical protein